MCYKLWLVQKFEYNHYSALASSKIYKLRSLYLVTILLHYISLSILVWQSLFCLKMQTTVYLCAKIPPFALELTMAYIAVRFGFGDRKPVSEARKPVSGV